MAVEFRDTDGKWYAVPGATAEVVFPNSYQVRFSILPRWAQQASLLETMVFRIDGRVCARAFLETEDGSALTMMMLVA